MLSVVVISNEQRRYIQTKYLNSFVSLHSGHDKTSDTLISYGANVNSKNNFDRNNPGKTSLHEAASEGNI